MRADENIELAGEAQARMKGESIRSDDQYSLPWEFSDAINSFESLLRGMVEEFEENCETLMGSKLFVEISVGSLCFPRSCGISPAPSPCPTLARDRECAKLSFELPKTSKVQPGFNNRALSFDHWHQEGHPCGL